jgi:Domain of unknown function (DUF4062)
MEQFKYIKKVIDQCDYYVLIIGDRYGSIAPDGVSFTEKEYHYAIKTGRVVLAFVKDSLAELSDESPEAKKLKVFREHVKSKRVVHLWKVGDDLKYPVSRSLLEAFEQHPREGWVRATKPKSYMEHVLAFAVALGLTIVFLAKLLPDSFFDNPQVTPPAKVGSVSPGTQETAVTSEPSKAPKTNLSAADVSTKVAIWQSVQTKFTNEFTRVLNDLSDLQGSWDVKDKSARAGWIARIPDLRRRFVDNSQQLEELRREYPQYGDISDSLKQTQSDGFLAALDQFAQAYGQEPDKSMRTLAGELQRHWNLMVGWNTDLQRLAARKQSELQ